MSRNIHKTLLLMMASLFHATLADVTIALDFTRESEVSKFTVNLAGDNLGFKYVRASDNRFCHFKADERWIVDTVDVDSVAWNNGVRKGQHFLCIGEHELEHLKDEKMIEKILNGLTKNKCHFKRGLFDEFGFWIHDDLGSGVMVTTVDIYAHDDLEELASLTPPLYIKTVGDTTLNKPIKKIQDLEDLMKEQIQWAKDESKKLDIVFGKESPLQGSTPAKNSGWSWWTLPKLFNSVNPFTKCKELCTFFVAGSLFNAGAADTSSNHTAATEIKAVGIDGLNQLNADAAVHAAAVTPYSDTGLPWLAPETNPDFKHLVSDIANQTPTTFTKGETLKLPNGTTGIVTNVSSEGRKCEVMTRRGYNYSCEYTESGIGGTFYVYDYEGSTLKCKAITQASRSNYWEGPQWVVVGSRVDS